MARFIVVLAFFAVACAKTVYVPVERKTEVVIEKRDTIIDVRIERETVEVYTKDTTAYARTAYAEAEASVLQGHLSLKLRNRADTTVRVPSVNKVTYVRDSIPYPVEVVTIKKERYVTWYDKLIRWVGSISFIVLVLIFGVRLLKWRIGFKF